MKKQKNNLSVNLTKYIFFDECANLFFKMSLNPEYITFGEETRLLKDLVDFIPSACSVIDMGIGSGLKVKDILEKNKGKSDFRYYGIDISPEMIKMAKKNLQQYLDGKNIKILETSYEDFLNNEKEIVKNNYSKYYLLLGGCITNEPFMKNSLKELKSKIFSGKVCLGLELFRNNEKKILSAYNVKEAYDIDFAFLKNLT